MAPSRGGPIATQRPNQVWPADFKGQFRTGDGPYCYPLTVTDHFSRSLLACHGLRSVKTVDTKPVFRTLFRAVGLPDAIRTDNGAPFASTGIHGLSALNVWWMQLGIVHQRIHPASPQENGTHERMHRELKRETTRPAASSLRAQQRRFEAFCTATTTSARTRASAIARRPRSGGRRPAPIRSTGRRPPIPRTWKSVASAPRAPSDCTSSQPFLSQVLQGEDIGLEEVGDGIWNIVYYSTLLGKIDERTLHITGTQ